jgi:uncharacterized membrane protein YgcG
MMKKILLLLSTGLLLCAVLHAQNPVAADSPSATGDRYANRPQERIYSFHADITLDTTGLAVITEHIRVYAAGDAIKRGIVRRIPVFREDRHGHKRRVDIHFTEVMKNGEPEPFTEKMEGEEKCIYIGSKEVLLGTGVYDYAITYETRGHVGFFDGYDEFYWNVTGNGWAFPIDSASAVLHLPGAAVIKEMACYTGVKGATERACYCARQDNGTAFIQTSRLLNTGEGLSFAVAWQAGLIKRPGYWETWYNSAREGLLAVAGLGLLLGVYYRNWRKYGRDPEMPVVVPSFHPPFNWSPAVLRYVFKKQVDNKVFSVALINMAVKKALTISGEKNKYAIRKKEGDSTLLAPEEKAALTALFKGKVGDLDIDNWNYARFNRAREAFEESLKKQVEIKSFFHKNGKQAFWGSALAIALLVVYFAYVTPVDVPVTTWVALPFGVVGTGMLILGISQLKASRVVGIILIIFGGIFALPALLVLVPALAALSPAGLLFCILVLVSWIVYLKLIKAPTVLGADAEAKIRGFKMYLETAEEHRLNMLMPPDKTPELFERLLPYAIALEVENEWGNKFQSVLEQAGYQPDWYTGNESGTYWIAHSFVSGFNRSVTDAQYSSSDSSGSSSGSGSSSWSSGSSGGGSSGGGGGGGGGGGW